MLRLAFDFIIAWRETRTRPNAYDFANKTTKKICFLTRFNTFVLFVKDEDFFYLLVFCLFYI